MSRTNLNLSILGNEIVSRVDVRLKGLKISLLMFYFWYAQRARRKSYLYVWYSIVAQICRLGFFIYNQVIVFTSIVIESKMQPLHISSYFSSSE